MGYIDDIQNIGSPPEHNVEEHLNSQLMKSQQQQDQLQQELINDIIVNDLVIIDGHCLHHHSSASAAGNDAIINCHFDKDGQIDDNYYVGHCNESDGSINESSNEVS